MRHPKFVTFASTLLLATLAATAHAELVPILNLKSYLDAASIVAKVKVSAVTAIAPPAATAPALIKPGMGQEFLVTANLLRGIKGEPAPSFTFKITQRPGMLDAGPQLEVGKTYVVLINAGDPPAFLGAMQVNEAAIDPLFGKEPTDLLLAELADVAAGKDAPQRIAALEQLGNLRDRRPAKVVAAAADDPDPDVIRAAVVAQYRMGIAPDAHKVMSVFNESVMDVWYQESGTPQKTADGKYISRREGGMSFMERGLPDFDYATYVREGVKLGWVRKDASTLYKFFGAPWKVQRRACVPEFIALLDNKDPMVQWWGVICLTHTVENKDGLPWDKVPPDADSYFTKWRTWWKDQGATYMAQKPEQ